MSKQAHDFMHLSGHELHFWLQIPEIMWLFLSQGHKGVGLNLHVCVLVSVCLCACVCAMKAIFRLWQHQEIPGDVFNKARQQRRRRRPEDRRMKTCWSGALWQPMAAVCLPSRVGTLILRWMIGGKKAKDFLQSAQMKQCPKCAHFPLFRTLVIDLSWEKLFSPVHTHNAQCVSINTQWRWIQLDSANGFEWICGAFVWTELNILKDLWLFPEKAAFNTSHFTISHLSFYKSHDKVLSKDVAVRCFYMTQLIKCNYKCIFHFSTTDSTVGLQRGCWYQVIPGEPD